MIKNVLVAGCSFTENQTWPSVLFSNANIKNIGLGGAGNEFIATATIDAVRSVRPDFVFLLWSGICRVDVSFSKLLSQSEFSQIQFKGRTRHSVTLFSGGDWTRDDKLDPPDLWKHPLLDSYLKLKYKNKDHGFLVDNSTYHIMSCHNFLASQNIPYKFGFIYNVFDSNVKNEPSCSKDQGYFKFLDWDKFIDFPPLEYGVKYDLLQDGFHLTQTGMNSWAEKIKNQVNGDIK